MRSIIVIIAVLSLASSASAQHCVRFGQRVAIKSPVQYQQVIAQPVVAQYQQPYQQQPIVIQNNYPPVGVGVGTTQYGYAQQQVAYASQPQLYSLDPTAVLREAARLTERAQDLADKGLGTYERISAVALTQQTVQQSLVSSPQPQQAPQAVRAGGSQSICITPDGLGGYKITLVDQPQAEAPAPAPPQSQSDPAGSSTPGIEQRFASIVSRSCTGCHNFGKASGGLSLVDGNGALPPLTDAQVAKVLDEVESGRMPKDAAPLSDDDVALMRTYFALSRGGER